MIKFHGIAHDQRHEIPTREEAAYGETTGGKGVGAKKASTLVEGSADTNEACDEEDLATPHEPLANAVLIMK